MVNLRKALALIFIVLLTVSFIPFSTAFAHTTAAPANEQIPEAGEAAETNEQAENPENAQGTQHEHHSSQETDNTQYVQLGGLEIVLLILFTLLVAVPSGLLWWFIARNRRH